MKKSLKNNAILNGVKQACSILFPMITFPYVSRTLGASNYGKVGFSESIVSYVAMIAGLGISSYAIREGAMLRDDTRKLKKTVNEIFTINCISLLFSFLVLFLSLLSVKKLEGYTWIILIYSLTVVFQTLGRDWLNSIYEDFEYTTIRYIVCQLVSMLLLFLLVRSREDFGIYPFVAISGIIAAEILNIIHIYHRYGIKLRISKIKDSLKHLKPIMIMFGTSVAMYIYINSDTTIIGFFMSDKDVGYYSVSVKIYMLVKGFFNAFLLVAVPRFSKELSEGQEDKVKEQLSTMISALVLFLLPAMAGLCCLSGGVIELFAGKEYLAGITSLRILSIALICATAACFYICDIMIVRKQEKSVFYATLISAVVNIVGNLIFIPVFGINAAAGTTFLSELIMLIWGIVKTKEFFDFNNYSVLITAFLGVVEVVAICLIMLKQPINSIWQIICSVIISLIIYGLSLLLTQKNMICMLISKKKK